MLEPSSEPKRCGIPHRAVVFPVTDEVRCLCGELMHRFIVHLGLLGLFGCTDGGTVNTDTGRPQDTDETDSDTDEMDSDTDSDTDMSDDTDTGDTERCPDDARFAIETTHGCILGSQLGNSETYLGIPYAAPPSATTVGLNRVQPHLGIHRLMPLHSAPNVSKQKTSQSVGVLPERVKKIV